ncbi:hypothetical protein P7C71_g2402, partial [Lecanoromycetidae sp. Uapishka_2]
MSSKNYMEMSSDRKRYKYDRRKYGGIKVTTLTDGQKSLEKISKGPAVPEVRINFDRKGQMWLSYVDAEFGYIANQYEGGFMEMSMRIHPDINLRTFRARMPPFIKRRNDPTYREIWTNNTLSNRARHFRERAGAISWAEHGVKSRIKEFLDDHVSQAARVNNSTRACRDLTLEEIHDLRKYSRERDA